MSQDSGTGSPQIPPPLEFLSPEKVIPPLRGEKYTAGFIMLGLGIYFIIQGLVVGSLELVYSTGWNAVIAYLSTPFGVMIAVTGIITLGRSKDLREMRESQREQIRAINENMQAIDQAARSRFN
jgi:hypothetical protein